MISIGVVIFGRFLIVSNSQITHDQSFALKPLTSPAANDHQASPVEANPYVAMLEHLLGSFAWPCTWRPQRIGVRKTVFPLGHEDPSGRPSYKDWRTWTSCTSWRYIVTCPSLDTFSQRPCATSPFRMILFQPPLEVHFWRFWVYSDSAAVRSFWWWLKHRPT